MPIGLYFREVNVYIDLAEIKYIYVCVCCSVMSNSATQWTYSLPGSSVHGILQAGILEWVAIPFSRGSS